MITPEDRIRLKFLDYLATDLERQILLGIGDPEKLRREWRALQDEMREIEAKDGQERVH